MAETVVRWRWIVVPGWIVAAVLAYLFAPGLSTLPTANVDFLIPKQAKAIKVEEESLELFRVPLLSQIAVVQREADGLPAAVQARTARVAVALDQHRLPRFPQRSFAVPIFNTGGLIPAARERSTTAITYIFFSPEIPAVRQRGLTVLYARRVGDHARLTGLIPGQLEQSRAVKDALPEVEYATLGLIVFILALYFRGFLAPAVSLGAAGVAYVLAQRAIGFYGTRTGSSLPHEIEPLVVVLLLGVITDYSVFFLNGMRARLRQGDEKLEAATATTRRFLPIIATAGLLVAAGVATLRVATLDFLQSLGPAMAITTIVAAVVALTFVPAAMAILGEVLYWPGLRRAQPAAGHHVARFTGRALGLVLSPRRAIPAALVIAVVLGALATGLRATELEVTPIGPLTSSAPAKRAATWAAEGFVPGIIAPTEVLVQRRELPIPAEGLAGFGRFLRSQDGVAAALGPGDFPGAYPGVLTTEDGRVARYLVVLEDSPFGPDAVETLDRVARSVPDGLDRLGLGDVSAAYTGGTAIAKDTVDDIQHDLLYVLLAAFAVNLVLLMVFLRSLVAPFLLVGASALGLAATIGLTTLVFQGILDYSSLTYYVPIAVSVLLISFGSDYNVFIVGRIYQESQGRPLREAIAVAVPEASRAVTVAGVTLAGSFATLALIPLSSFREFAFAMSVGVLLDTFVIRSLLIPAMISAVGERVWWPSRAAIGGAALEGGSED